jgi:D-sedoheptulose 7-phosphate isomerase
MNDKTFTEYITRIHSSLKLVNIAELNYAKQIILDTTKQNGKIWLIGNGGSAATSSHFATDLSRCTSENGEPIRAISLCDNTALITAIGNDFTFEEIFKKQLEILGTKGDLLISISASGNSSNLLQAIKYAKSHSIKTLSLVGFDGGLIHKLSDNSILVQTDVGDYGVAEDCHSMICHFISSALRK